MLKPLTKKLVSVVCPRQTDEYDVTLPYWLINAYAPHNYYPPKNNVVVEVAEADPQKRTITIDNQNFFVSLPYIQYYSVVPEKGEPSNFITCTIKPFEKIDDLCHLPMPNIMDYGSICLGKNNNAMSQFGFVRPRDLMAYFWQSQFNLEAYHAIKATMEYNGMDCSAADLKELIKKFFNIWANGLKGIKFCPLSSSCGNGRNLHFS